MKTLYFNVSLKLSCLNSFFKYRYLSEIQTKMDSVIECSVCKNKLEQPVILPCGCTVCKKHENEAIAKIYCPKCRVEHDIPEKGFISNTLAVSLLEMNLDKVDLGDEHKAAVKSFKSLKEQFEELKRIQDNSELEIDRVIEELKTKLT